MKQTVHSFTRKGDTYQVTLRDAHGITGVVDVHYTSSSTTELSQNDCARVLSIAHLLLDY